MVSFPERRVSPAMSLEVHQLTKRYEGREVVHDVSFRVDDGELVALLGPSGSGKSTILRIVAGLTSAELGRVSVDGLDVTTLPPQSRDLGFVFQNYALFEHLTVADNVEFALRVRKVERGQRQLRRDELLELVGLGGSARKYPAQLSGGQRQRTALARALAHRPRLLLLDEPFGALDARIRQELRQGLRELLKRISTTAIFVTHDQEEAFAVADRIMVVHRGRLLEQGPSQQLYGAPQTEFVAGFVGRANLLPGELTPDGVRIRLDGEPAHANAIPKRIKVLLRPEKLALLPADSAIGGQSGFAQQARIERIEYLGASERVHLAIEAGCEGISARRYLLEALRTIEVATAYPLQSGDRVTVSADHLHAISRPNLRVLVLAGDDIEGRALAEVALCHGERTHALVTLLGAAVRDPLLHARLEHYRQAFAGDLKLVDVQALGLGLWQVANKHLEGERYDLVMLPASMRQPDALVDFLRGNDVRQVLLAAAEGTPLAADGGRWSVLLRAFAASQPDLDLLAELASAGNAQVDVRDLDGTLPANRPAQRWHDALALRHVPFTLDARPVPNPRAGRMPIDESADMVAVDLGPRAGLGERQKAWLAALDSRWTFLMVQPDESDLRLVPRVVFHEDRSPPRRATFPTQERTTP